MIKDMTAEDIRKWVGETTYEADKVLSDGPDSSLHKFLYWAHHNMDIPSADTGSTLRNRFVCERIRAGTDEQVLQWYLQFLLNGGKAK